MLCLLALVGFNRFTLSTEGGDAAAEDQPAPAGHSPGVRGGEDACDVVAALRACAAATNAAIDATRAVIESKGGKLAVKIAPRVTTQREESDLRRTLAGVAEEENEDDSDGDE